MGTHTKNVNTLAGVMYGYPHTECKHTGRGHLWVPTHRMWTLVNTLAGVIYTYPHTECGLRQGSSMVTHTQNVDYGRGHVWVPTHRVWTLAGVINGYPHTVWTLAEVIYGYPHTECKHTDRGHL